MDGEKERDVAWSKTVMFVLGLDWIGLGWMFVPWGRLLGHSSNIW